MRYEKIARQINLQGFNWLQTSFKKVFEEFKNHDDATKEKIIFLEKSIDEKFKKIKSEIDYKVEKYKFEVENGFAIRVDVRILNPIFDDFVTGHWGRNDGLPLHEQNRIDLIWHDMKQNIEVKLEALSKDIGKPIDDIPWHWILCNLCKIYRKVITIDVKKLQEKHIKYFPPRFASEQDPDMII